MSKAAVKEGTPWVSKAISLFKDGLSIADIARSVKKSRQRVHQVLISEAGYRSRDVGAYRKNIISMYRKGKALDEIVVETGKSSILVRRVLEHAGVDISPDRKKRWFTEALRLVDRGLCIAAISSRLAVDPQATYNFLKKNLTREKFDELIRIGEIIRLDKVSRATFGRTA